MNEPRYGTVLVRDHYFTDENGDTYQGVTGLVESKPASDILGFEPNNRDSNWVAVINGQETEVIMLGCGILNVIYHPEGYYKDATAYKVIP